MRFDDVGMFWQDIKVEKIKKEKYVPKPPDPYWLAHDYVPPVWEEVKAFVLEEMTDAEVIEAWREKHPLVWDIETYPNYFLLGFRSTVTGKHITFEMQRGGRLDLAKLRWVLQSFLIVGFNCIEYDLPMAHAALCGWDTDKLMAVSHEIITGGEDGRGIRSFQVYKHFKMHRLDNVDMIDLIELTPLGPSLKVCSGRLHAPMMMDLPYAPGKELTPEQIKVVRWYWSNDLGNTQLLFKYHTKAIELRAILSNEYGVDVRSKSDPQIAEAVIRTEITRLTGKQRLDRAVIEPGRWFNYIPPTYLQYQTPMMQWVLDFIKQQKFVIDASGGPMMPKDLAGMDIPIAGTVYRMGIGGLHSQEKSVIHVSDDEHEISDNDVTSYYPSLIIQQGMYPPNIGPAFLQVFKRIYDRRITAKREGDKDTAETLKIVLNGTFGKTGERGGYSVVYYPEMMIQVTVTGQLALLMLIEALELNGIQVISANTDGIVIKCHRSMLERKAQIIRWWEEQTGLGMESTTYKAVYSRDVNSYLAFYEKPKGNDFAKAKGAYSFVKDSVLKVNPTHEICTEAVIHYIAKGTPIEETIQACTDFTKFIVTRRVNTGAFKEQFLGKAIRWYYSTEDKEPIINARSGHKVPKSEGAKPCMRMPDALPDDIDYQWYIDQAYSILEDFNPKDEKPEQIEEKAA